MKCNGLHRGLKKNFQTHEAEAEGNRACESRGLCQNRRLAQRRANDQHGLSACFYSPVKRKEVEILPYGGGTYTFLIWRRRRTGQIPFLI